MADAIFKWEKYAKSTHSQKQLRLTFKKRLFLRPHVIPANRVEFDLLYYQGLDDVRDDHFPLEPDEAVLFVALRAQVKNNNRKKIRRRRRRRRRRRKARKECRPANTRNSRCLTTIDNHWQIFAHCSFRPTYHTFVLLVLLLLQVDYGDEGSPQPINYAQLVEQTMPQHLHSMPTGEVVNTHKKLRGMDREVAKKQFLERLMAWPLYGATIFEVLVRTTERERERGGGGGGREKEKKKSFLWAW